MSVLHTHRRSAMLTFAMTTIASTPLIFATAGTVTIASASLTAIEAQAFGWSDIKKGAKKVGRAAKKVGKAAASNAKDFGGAFKRDMKKIGRGIEKNAKGAASNARDFGGALKRDAKKIGSGIKKAWCSPGFTCREFKPPTIPPRTDHMRDGLLDYARRGNLNRKPAATTFKPGIARDKSVHGRPVGKTQPTRKVRGIRKGDVITTRRSKFARNQRVVKQKAARRNGRQPYWKKYRENPPATKRNLRRNNKRTIRSRIGRAVGAKRRGVRSQSAVRTFERKSRRINSQQRRTMHGFRSSRNSQRRVGGFSRSASRHGQSAGRMQRRPFSGRRSWRR